MDRLHVTHDVCDTDDELIHKFDELLMVCYMMTNK